MSKDKKMSKKNIVIISVAVVALILAVVITVLAVSSIKPETAVVGTKEYSLLAQNDEQTQQFAEQFFKVEELYSLQQEYVPVEFNDIYNDYNELQKMQGLDLVNYKGALCKLYIYKLSDFEIDGKTAYMSVLVNDQRVIGGHISTMTQGSPMYTFDGEKHD